MLTGHPLVAADPQSPEVDYTNWNATHYAALAVSSKSADYTIVEADAATVIRITGATARALTLPAASGVRDKWAVWIENATTDYDDPCSIVRASSDTIDGQTTIYTYPGDLRLVFKSGAGTYESVLFRGGVYEETTVGATTFRLPPCTMARVQLWGGGGGGGSGRRGTAGTARGGGAGRPDARRQQHQRHPRDGAAVGWHRRCRLHGDRDRDAV